MLTAFFGCTPKKDNSVSEAGSSERDIVFTYSCVKCTDSVMYETSDDITVVSSVDDLNKYKTKLASTVDTERAFRVTVPQLFLKNYRFTIQAFLKIKVL